MNAKPSIRPMDEHDLDDVARLLSALFAQEHEFTPEPRRQRRALELLLAQPDLGIVLVAHRRGLVIGTVTLLRSVSTALGGEVAWLEDLVVEPSERGGGTGGALLDAAASLAETRSWRRISVLTDADNLRAQHLYSRHGFTRSEMVVLRRSG